jgi:hypothetical protein
MKSKYPLHLHLIGYGIVAMVILGGVLMYHGSGWGILFPVGLTLWAAYPDMFPKEEQESKEDDRSV